MLIMSVTSAQFQGLGLLCYATGTLSTKQLQSLCRRSASSLYVHPAVCSMMGCSILAKPQHATCALLSCCPVTPAGRNKQAKLPELGPQSHWAGRLSPAFLCMIPHTTMSSRLVCWTQVNNRLQQSTCAACVMLPLPQWAVSHAVAERVLIVSKTSVASDAGKVMLPSIAVCCHMLVK